MMVPHADAMIVFFQVNAQPIAGQKEFADGLLLKTLLVQIEIPQTPLCNGDGVVLLTNTAVVVELWNTVWIGGAGVASLLREIHVVLAKQGG